MVAGVPGRVRPLKLKERTYTLTNGGFNNSYLFTSQSLERFQAGRGVDHLYCSAEWFEGPQLGRAAIPLARQWRDNWGFQNMDAVYWRCILSHELRGKFELHGRRVTVKKHEVVVDQHE